MELLLGLLTGFLFGFLLQKGQVLRFERQVGFLLLKDMTIIKFMLSAVIVGMIGLHILANFELITFKLKSTVIAANLLGGLIFGIGWAIAGYCPGTAIGALGEGRVHAFWVILGMLTGAGLYAEIYPYLKDTIASVGDLGKVTIPEVLQLPPWSVMAVFIAIMLLLFYWFEKKKL